MTTVAFLGFSLYAAWTSSDVAAVPLADVSGLVTQSGKPAANLWIAFQPLAGGRPSVARSDANGHYALRYVEQTGALVGSHRVSIGCGGESDDFGNLKTPLTKLMTIEVEVQIGDNQFNFDLEP